MRRAQWKPGSPGGEGRGVGLAFARYKNIGNYAAVIAEVELTERVAVKRVVAAVDCGCIVNPDGVLNQLEGGIVQVTSWVLKEQVQFDDHRITSTDWDSYPILKFSEVPNLHTDIIEAPEDKALGMGECSFGPTAAAIGNAVAHVFDDERGDAGRNFGGAQFTASFALCHADSRVGVQWGASGECQGEYAHGTHRGGDSVCHYFSFSETGISCCVERLWVNSQSANAT